MIGACRSHGYSIFTASDRQQQDVLNTREVHFGQTVGNRSRGASRRTAPLPRCGKGDTAAAHQRPVHRDDEQQPGSRRALRTARPLLSRTRTGGRIDSPASDPLFRSASRLARARWRLRVERVGELGARSGHTAGYGRRDPRRADATEPHSGRVARSRILHAAHLGQSSRERRDAPGGARPFRRTRSGRARGDARLLRHDRAAAERVRNRDVAGPDEPAQAVRAAAGAKVQPATRPKPGERDLPPISGKGALEAAHSADPAA